MDHENERRKSIKEMYDFDNWRQGGGQARPKARMLESTAMATPLPLIKRHALPDGGYLDTYGNKKVAQVTVWIHPFTSPEKAHEAMIDHLLGCSAPHPLPQANEKGLATGDVAFAGLDDPVTSLVFVRDNHLVRVHSVGDTPYPLKAFADHLDIRITSGL